MRSALILMLSWLCDIFLRTWFVFDWPEKHILLIQFTKALIILFGLSVHLLFIFLLNYYLYFFNQSFHCYSVKTLFTEKYILMPKIMSKIMACKNTPEAESNRYALLHLQDLKSWLPTMSNSPMQSFDQINLDKLII